MSESGTLDTQLDLELNNLRTQVAQLNQNSELSAVIFARANAWGLSMKFSRLSQEHNEIGNLVEKIENIMTIKYSN